MLISWTFLGQVFDLKQIDDGIRAIERSAGVTRTARTNCAIGKSARGAPGLETPLSDLVKGREVELRLIRCAPASAAALRKPRHNG
jgi:hypothetical protein